jgi:hypothetical protein
MAKAPILIIDRINSDLERVLKTHKEVVLTHTPCAAYLTKGFPSLRSKWYFDIKWVKIIPRDAYTYLEYHFYDKTGNVIKTKSETPQEIESFFCLFQKIIRFFWSKSCCTLQSLSSTKLR